MRLVPTDDLEHATAETPKTGSCTSRCVWLSLCSVLVLLSCLTAALELRRARPSAAFVSPEPLSEILSSPPNAPQLLPPPRSPPPVPAQLPTSWPEPPAPPWPEQQPADPTSPPATPPLCMLPAGAISIASCSGLDKRACFRSFILKEKVTGRQVFGTAEAATALVKRCVHNRRDAKSTRDSMRVPDAFSQGLAAPHKDGVSLVDLSRTRMELGHSNRTSA